MDLISYLPSFILSDWTWAEVKSAAELIVKLLFVLAIFGCLLRLKTIRSIITEFREQRGPLWDLRNTVRDLKELEPVIKGLSEQVDAVRKQVAELQVLSVSTRTGASEEVTQEVSATATPRATEAESQNWETLRDIWKRNNARLEYVIDQIEDGRTKLAYDRMPRTNYTRIIDRLESQGFISHAAATASRSLHDLFNSYRPKNRDVPNEVVQSLPVLDAQLDKELVMFKAAQAADLFPEPPAPPVPSSRQNGRALETRSPLN